MVQQFAHLYELTWRFRPQENVLITRGLLLKSANLP